MRRVLVLSPHWPPADIADMHRVRMTVGHYAECGWDPVVLTVRAEDTGRLMDETLVHMAPKNVRLEVVKVPPNPVFQAAKVRAIGVRGAGPLYRAGAALLERERFDLVFISTASFPLMHLGARWKAEFGVPFVLDFQDPWATYPESGKVYFRKGLRHSLMRAWHRRQEGRTLPHADGLMAVSQVYIDLLSDAYPPVAGKPSLVSPFGFSRADFAAARAHGAVLPALQALKDAGHPVCLFAGRVAPTMERTLARLFDLIAASRGKKPFERLRWLFLGTGYSAGTSEQLATKLAREAGISDLVTEVPDRVSLIHAWATTLAADVHLVMGSEDAGYTPSKLNALLSLPQPLLCAAPAGSPAMSAVSHMDTVLTVPLETATDPAVFAARLAALMDGKGDYAPRMTAAEAYEAAACAARDCALFDRVAR